MRRSRGGYGSYRGHRTLHDILKLVAIALGVLVLAALALLFAGGEYIVFTDHGLEIQLPFLEEKSPAQPPSTQVEVHVEQNDRQQQQSEQVSQPQQPLLAKKLALEQVLDGTAAQILRDAGANALILEMKTPQGTLNWCSDTTLAQRTGVNMASSAENEVLRQYTKGEIYTVALVDCFRDNTLPYQLNNLALRAGYGNWRDENGLRWLSPDSEDARDYLIQLCLELAQLGFDEIVLEHFTFPLSGNQGAIVQSGSYLEQTHGAVTTQFVKDVQAALAPLDTGLSVRLQVQEISPLQQLYALELNALAPHLTHIWLEGAQDETLDAALDAGEISLDKTRIVQFFGDLDENLVKLGKI